MRFSSKELIGKFQILEKDIYGQMNRKIRICSYLLKKVFTGLLLFVVEF